MIAKGEPWGHEPRGAAEGEVAGEDHALAAAVVRAPNTRLRFRPSPGSDFAKAVGLSPVAPDDIPIDEVAATELPCDLLRGRVDDCEIAAVNMIVVGVPPDGQMWYSRDAHVRVEVDGREVHIGPATAVVIANGQYLRGADLVPRGHPGDGRVEVHTYTLRRAERHAMIDRLPSGEHLPHPRISTMSGRRVVVESTRAPFPVEVDGIGAGATRRLEVEVTPGAFSLLV